NQHPTRESTMPRAAKLCRHEGHWYTKAGSASGMYFGRCDQVSYGVAIRRADVKDLIFPGNLQEIMNRVLAAERNSEAQLVEARTKADTQRIGAQAQAEATRLAAEAEAEARLAHERSEAQAAELPASAELRAETEKPNAGA